MNLLFIFFLSCINVNMNGKLKHDVDVDLKVKLVDDTGDTGGADEPIFK